MITIMRNPEWKSIAFKIILFQLMLGFILFMMVSHQLQSIKQGIVDNNAALVGHLLQSEPKLKDEIIPYITQGAQSHVIAEGRKILMQYGYDENMAVQDLNVLSNSSLPLSTAVVVILFAVPVLLLLLWEYRKVFQKIRNVALAAELVVEKKFDIPLVETAEGDLGWLGRSFNMMADRLNHSLDLLKQDKIFLHNLISDISHQLKTPLASLIVFNENLLNDRNMKEDMKLTFLERSRQQLDRMEWLIVSLLKLARVEAGTIVFQHERINLGQVIYDATNTLQLLAQQKRQQIMIVGNDKLYMHGDNNWLNEAFINLIKNALEHNKAEGTIDIRLEETPLFYNVTITDYGEGITEEDLPHIFKRFYRGKNSTKPQSVGIGLALAKSIIEEHDGMIQVKSRIGEGSTFTVSFHKN
ncbi:signal transduction histidine kinase [Paenibacillus turicensis]|uniref:histidine kinase n=1 Tax=Paenibacillus turicensis TaxID=160487 RepID=A0ABS4FX50_9BACL|nr:HAMP domain-containing sensor histidine kinase [Paenibacillus turicensis]MBP1907159.1 signal transduction histidine kinase [Paenibacillus turicensis]